MDLEAIGKAITDKKIAIGVIDHRKLQVETPEQVATLIRSALKHIPVERLAMSSDCGIGREGMSRRIAFYKMVALVQRHESSSAESWASPKRRASQPIRATR